MSSLLAVLGIDRLSPAERLQLIAEIWDSLPEQAVQPAAPNEPTLDELLQGVTDENVPDEWETGPAG